MASSISAVPLGGEIVVPNKRLLVLCGHEPTLDPRIDWCAQAGVDRGWDVRVHGFCLAEPAVWPTANSHQYMLSRGTPSGPKLDQALVIEMILRGGIVSWFWLALGGLGLGLYKLGKAIAFLWGKTANFRQTTGLAKFLFRPLNQLFAKCTTTIVTWIHARTDFTFRKWHEGLRGYEWYIKILMLPQAYCALAMFPQDGWRPDIIHAHDPDSLLCATLLKRRFHARLVYDAHEYGPDAYLLEPRPRPAFFALEAALLRQVDSAVTVTPSIAAKFQGRYKSKPYFDVIPNASPTPDTLVALDDPFIRLASQGRVRFLFQGGLSANRGVEELLDAWKDLDERQACLFIRGPENAFREDLITLARATGRLGSSIFFLPSVSEHDLIASAMNADVGLITYLSHIENHHGACPNKMSQYMQAGVMQIAADLPFVRSVISQAQCGIIYDDTTRSSLVAALQEAATNEDLRRKCGSNGRIYARSTFNYGYYKPVLDRLYGLEITDTGQELTNPSHFEEFDRDAFEAPFLADDARLDMDISTGVFSADDVKQLKNQRNTWNSPQAL